MLRYVLIAKNYYQGTIHGSEGLLVVTANLIILGSGV